MLAARARARRGRAGGAVPGGGGACGRLESCEVQDLDSAFWEIWESLFEDAPQVVWFLLWVSSNPGLGLDGPGALWCEAGDDVLFGLPLDATQRPGLDDGCTSHTTP